MGCCCCKSKRVSSTNDATISALLDETINPLLPVSDAITNDIKDCDTVRPPKLLPDIRSLQSLIFQCIHGNEEYYDLYPNYGKLSSIWNSTSINEEKWDISHKLLNISLIIALYTNGANIAYFTNLYNILDHCIRINLHMILLPDLIHIIISFIPGITFCDDIKDVSKKKQLEFGYERGMVTFKYMSTDFLNIRSDQEIIGPKSIINCYITSKGNVCKFVCSLYLKYFIIKKYIVLVQNNQVTKCGLDWSTKNVYNFG